MVRLVFAAAGVDVVVVVGGGDDLCMVVDLYFFSSGILPNKHFDFSSLQR